MHKINNIKIIVFLFILNIYLKKKINKYIYIIYNFQKKNIKKKNIYNYFDILNIFII